MIGSKSLGEEQNRFGFIDFEYPVSNFMHFHIQQPIYEYVNNGKKNIIQLIFSRAIIDTITNLRNMNRMIANNTKIFGSVFQSGKDNNKGDSFKLMLEHPLFLDIKTAYQLLDQPDKQMLKYTVQDIQGLLFKLGINTCKIETILLNKRLYFNSLSVWGLSVALLMFTEYQYFLKKKMKNDNQIQNSVFLRQFPKITIIKLSYRRNTYETQLIQKAQYQFYSSNTRILVKKIQYIQLYQIQDQSINYNKQTNYEYITSINIKQVFKIGIPLSFQLLYLFKHYIFHLVTDFKPDMVLFIQSYPQNRIAIDPQIRGLLLTEIIQHLTPKILYMRQYGPQQFLYQQLTFAFKGSPGRWHSLINQQTYEILKKIQHQLYDAYANGQKQTTKFIKFVKKIMLDDLVFSSLALLQKGNFHKVIERSNQHIYNPEFIKNLCDLICLKMEAVKKLKKQQRQQLVLQLKRQQKTLINFVSFLSNTSSLKDEIYNRLHQNKHNNIIENLKTNKYEVLITKEQRIINYYDNDQVLVDYKKDRIYVFILRQLSYIFLVKMDYEDKFSVLVDQTKWQQEQLLKGCTLVCSDLYLYRAFGIYLKDQFSFNNSIYRHRIIPNQSQSLQTWQHFSSHANIKMKEDHSNNEKYMEIQRKHSAFGFFQKNTQMVFFMGGYVDSFNEDKIGKKVYVIQHDTEIYSTLKTNNFLLNIAKNSTPVLFPFIFGMPFYNQSSKQQSKIMILSTNSDYNNLNNSGKIFMTEYLVRKNLIGINCQHKLVAKEKQQNTINQMKMIDYIVLSCYKINRYQGRVALKVPQQGSFIFEIDQKTLSLKAYLLKENSMQMQLNFVLNFDNKSIK